MTRRASFSVLALASTIAFAMIVGAAASAEPVLVGMPDARVEAGPDGASHLDLSEAERQQYAVVINRVGDKLVWASRDGVELVRRSSGIYDIYIAVTGSGYVKVERGDLVGSPRRYLEHLHQGLATITYFGTDPYYDRGLVEQ